MQSDRDAFDDAELREASIDIESWPERSPTFAAVAALRGEHDIATAPAIADALRGFAGNVLVDLSDCGFIDSSVIPVLIATAKDLERDGYFLELVATPETMIARTLEVVGMRDFIVVHPAFPKE